MSKSREDFHEEVRALIDAARREFGRTNQDKKKLTPADRERLKAVYIEQFVVPQARTLIEKHFPGQVTASEAPADHPAGRKPWIDPNSHALAFLREGKTKEDPAE